MAAIRISRAPRSASLARRFEKQAARRAPIAWDRFERDRHPPAALALSHAQASRLAMGEYSAVEIFSRMAAALAIVGAPIEIVAEATQVPSDEIRHASIALRFAELCGERDEDGVAYDTATHAAQWTHAPAIEEVDRLFLQVAAIGETMACALLAACRQRARDPVARAVYSAVVSDEIHHARLGWYYLAWRAPAWSQAERQRAADAAAESIVSVERQFARGRDAPPKARAAAKALGVLDTRGQREAIRAAMVDEIVPGLDAPRPSASYAWARRERVW